MYRLACVYIYIYVIYVYIICQCIYTHLSLSLNTHADTISRPSRWFHALPVPEPGQEEDICPICPKDTRHMVSIKREGQQNIIDRSLRRILRETNSFLELLKFLAIIMIHIYIIINNNNNKNNNNNNNNSNNNI